MWTRFLHDTEWWKFADNQVLIIFDMLTDMDKATREKFLSQYSPFDKHNCAKGFSELYSEIKHFEAVK